MPLSVLFSFLLSLLTSSHITYSLPQEKDSRIERNVRQNGNEYIVTIVIHTTGIGEFARYTDSIPSGSKASVIDAGDAAFRSDGTVKFIWTSYPKTQPVVVRYKLTYDGNLNIYYKGVLAFVSDNIKQQVELNPRDISWLQN
jgi:hypothetical protein